MRWLERLFVVIALVAFGIAGVEFVRARTESAAARRTLTAGGAPGSWVSRDEADPVASASPAAFQPSAPVAVGRADVVAAPSTRLLVGELRIPRIELSTMVFAVRDPASLRHAAGHLPDTPLPWEAGNSAIAGHRDSAFRQLRAARPGDEVSLVTPYGTFRYQVTRAFVVYPEEVWVLKDDAAALTLITCFPFRWVGTAPERWIVHAKRLQP